MDLLSSTLPPARPPNAKTTPSARSLAQIDPTAACQQPFRVLVRQGIVPPPVDFPLVSAETLGFRPVATQFVPRTYFRRYARVPGSYDADYLNFALNGKQAQALKNVLRLANTRKIPLVFVNLPLTPIYLDSTRLSYEDQFRVRMQQVSRAQPFIFQDLLQQARLGRNYYFEDPSHLNRYGAVAVATEVGKVLIEPLSQVFPKSDAASRVHSTIAPIWFTSRNTVAKWDIPAFAIAITDNEKH